MLILFWNNYLYRQTLTQPINYWPLQLPVNELVVCVWRQVPRVVYFLNQAISFAALFQHCFVSGSKWNLWCLIHASMAIVDPLTEWSTRLITYFFITHEYDKRLCKCSFIRQNMLDVISFPMICRCAQCTSKTFLLQWFSLSIGNDYFYNPCY